MSNCCLSLFCGPIPFSTGPSFLACQMSKIVCRSQRVLVFNTEGEFLGSWALQAMATESSSS